MAKKTYPGGFRLTMATAKRLAVQELGTAKGLGPDFTALTQYGIQEKSEMLRNWVGGNGPDFCHKAVDEAWNKGQ